MRDLIWMNWIEKGGSCLCRKSRGTSGPLEFLGCKCCFPSLSRPPSLSPSPPSLSPPLPLSLSQIYFSLLGNVVLLKHLSPRVRKHGSWTPACHPCTRERLRLTLSGLHWKVLWKGCGSPSLVSGTHPWAMAALIPTTEEEDFPEKGSIALGW